MPTPVPLDLLKRQRRMQQLQARLYAQADPAQDESLFEAVLDAERQLPKAKAAAATAADENPAATQAPAGPIHLGPETTKLKADIAVRRTELPTSIYHLLR